MAVEAVVNGGYHFILEVVEPVHVETSEGSEEIEEEAVEPRLKSKFSGKSDVLEYQDISQLRMIVLAGKMTGSVRILTKKFNESKINLRLK